MAETGSNAKNSHCAYVGRFTPETGHRSARLARQKSASSRQSAANNWPRAIQQSMRFVHRGGGLIFTPASVRSKLISPRRLAAVRNTFFVFRPRSPRSWAPERCASLQNEMCIDGEFRLRSVEDRCGFRRHRVVVENAADTIFCSSSGFEPAIACTSRSTPFPLRIRFSLNRVSPEIRTDRPLSRYGSRKQV